jgi:hypothetical protein
MENPCLPHQQFTMYSQSSAVGQMIAQYKSSHPEEESAGQQPSASIVAAPRCASSMIHRPMMMMKLVAPYFDYTDHSHVTDVNPSVPLTAPGRLPNFPVKMLAILSREDLSHIISWMPHGRSWRVLKPREFEVKVIPAYFEHSKFSSFIRQANGWGFRRITKGPDRNSYYHELFLRGLPHLTKQMQRPHPSQKPALNPHTEPKFYEISQEHPLPECSKEKGFANEADKILVQCALVQRGNLYNGISVTTSEENQQQQHHLSHMQSAEPMTSPSSSMMMPQRTVSVVQEEAPIQQHHHVHDDWEPMPVGQNYSYSGPTYEPAPAPEPVPCMEPLTRVMQNENQQVYRHHAAPAQYHQEGCDQAPLSLDHAMAVPLANLPSCDSFGNMMEGFFAKRPAHNLYEEQSHCMEPMPMPKRARYHEPQQQQQQPRQQQHEVAAPRPRMVPSSNFANATWTNFAANEPVVTMNHITECNLDHRQQEALDDFESTIRATDSFINALDLGHDVQNLFDF